MALNVTSSSFHASWNLNSFQNHTFHVQVYKGREALSDTWTRAQTLAVSDLEAGVLYRVRVSYQGCQANVSATLAVKTGKVLVRQQGFLEWACLSQSSGTLACHMILLECRGGGLTIYVSSDHLTVGKVLHGAYMHGAYTGSLLIDLQAL